MAGLLEMLQGLGGAQPQGAAMPAPQQAPSPMAGLGGKLAELGPIIAMMDPMGRNNTMAAAMMQMQQGKKKDARDTANQNQTVQWLKTQGMGEQEASYLASDKDALRSWYGAWKTGDKPDWKIQRLINDQGQEQDFMVDMRNPERRNPIGGPKSDLLSPDNEAQKIRIAKESRPVTNVDARQMGTVPPGYKAEYDANGQVVQLSPIPGGPVDNSAKQAAADENKATATDIITNAASKARSLIGDWSTGTVGRVMSNLSESDAAELYRQAEVLKSNAKIENLQAMRAASPTGGALGSVSNQENEMLAAKSGALDPSAGPEKFKAALDDYERTLLRIVHGNKEGDRIYEGTRQTTPKPPAGGNISDGTVIENDAGQRMILRGGKWEPM